MKYIPLAMSVLLAGVAGTLWGLKLPEWGNMSLIFSLYFFFGYHITRIEKLIKK